MTLVEIGGLILIIAAGFREEGGQLITRLPEMIPAAGDLAVWKSVGGTTLIAVFAFIGFEHLVNIAEELKDPRRTLPRALFITLGVTSILYVAVIWVAVIAVPPDQLARSPAPLATVFQRLTGFPLITMSAVAGVATLNGVVVHVIMIARVLYGISSKGDLPRVLAKVNPVTRTPLVATATAVTGILFLSLVVPLEGLADWAARGTLVIFAGINLALIRIKGKQDTPREAFRCPLPVAYLGLFSSSALLVFDLVF
jgi:amino acid transporter